MASSRPLALVAVLLMTLNLSDVTILAYDVCMVCPRDCRQYYGNCWSSGSESLRCYLRFDLSPLTVLGLDTANCSLPEASEAPRVTGTGGGNFSLSTCSGFHLSHQGGCLKTLPPQLYCPYNATRAISVTDNQISEFPPLSCLPLLGFLNLSGNSLQNVPRDAFLENPDVREIFLDYNQITYIHPQALLATAVSNKLISIDASVFVRTHPFSYFDFSSNSITTFTNELNWNPKISLRYGPGLVRFANNQFTGAESQELFKTLGFHDPIELGVFVGWGWDYRGNPIQCDCELFVVAKWVQHLKQFFNRDYYDVRCVTPPSTKGVSLFDVPLEQMVCGFNASCPANCYCQNRPAKETLSVNCSSSDMTSLPEVMPVDWLYNNDLTLDFNNNSLTRLDPQSYFKRTKQINLRGNDLQNIHEDVPKTWTNMELIDLRQNNLKDLPRTMQILKPDVLWIDPHTLVCSCELLEWAPSWLTGASEHSDIRNMSCLTDDGRTLLIVSASRQNLDCDQTPSYSIIYYWLMGAGAFVLVVLAALMVLFRFELVLLMNTAKQSLRRRNKRRKFDFDALCRHYHVFISVSSESQEDMGWVRTSLLPRLETAGLTSYLPPRDCPPGSVEMDEVTKRLHDCASAVIVLTPEYVTNASALFQFRQAYSYMVAHGCGPFVVLMLRHVPRRAARDPHLRAMLTLSMSRDAEEGIDFLLKTLADVKDVAVDVNISSRP